jgi:amino acid adenylation domain-containing protein
VIISTIEIITEEEKKVILYCFNDTAREYPKDKTIHQLFAGQAAQTPDYIALHGCMIAWMGGEVGANRHPGVCPSPNALNVSLTYRQLNEQSNRLAGLLIEKGILTDTIVGIMVERSIEMIIGIMGILKAGGAYLPIDPEYPIERINYMLQDSNAKILINKSEIRNSKFETNPNNQNPNDQNKSRNFEIPFVLNLDHLNLNSLKGCPRRGLQHSAFSVQHSNHLAYIIYTSGSTGQPKGVMVEHRNVINLAISQKNRFAINEKDRILQFSSICFDASVEQIFIALFSGAVLVLIDKNTLLDNIKFEKLISSRLITHLHAVPSFLNNISLKEGYQLKRVISGGDVCPPVLVSKYGSYGDFYNEYGPTETTVTSIEMQCTDVSETLDHLSIGKPIANTFVYIFDKWLKMVPFGVAGEMYIGGNGVARGYLNRPELTAEKFRPLITLMTQMKNKVNKSFAGVKGGLFQKPSLYQYKTGDLCKWLPNGNIEFLGRIDYQVKIRGFRIELGEIENQLLKHKYIKEAVVLINEDTIKDKNLSAYIVPTEEILESELREYLQEKLPDYMIPSYFVQLEKIPLTSNGKIDRKVLPEPELKSNENYVAPQDEIEKKLVEIWSEVLAKDVLNDSSLSTAIGIDDNFFQLGGNSLKAIILTSKIHKYLDVKLPLSEFFKRPTIEKIAQYIKKSAVDIKYSGLINREEKEYYELSFAQQRLFILNNIRDVGTVYNLPIVLILEGYFDKTKFEEIFKFIIERHESLRTSFILVNGKPLQIIHKHVKFQIQEFVKDSSERNTTNITNHFLEKFIRPFDLSKAPLLRMAILELEDKKYALFFDMHHIITDGVSQGIFIRDFISLYKGEKLLPLSIQYKDFAEWQKGKEGKAIHAKQEKYWLNKFKQRAPVLSIPTDFPRPNVQSFQGDAIYFTFDQPLSQELKKKTKETGTTLNMFLLAIYNILLSKYSGQTDIVVGVTVAARTHPDIQDIIGFFVNTLPIRTCFEQEMAFEELLENVKENTLAAFENQDYPFDELVNKLNLSNNMSRNPLFDVAFVTQNMDVEDIEIENLKITPYNLQTSVSRFDMLIFVTEKENYITIKLEYATALFKRTTIEKFIERFRYILEQIITNGSSIKLKNITLSHDFAISKSSILQMDTEDFGF